MSLTFAGAVVQPEPKKDEIRALITMLKRRDFTQKSLIIADRGFESYNIIAHLQEKPNTDFLIRVKQSRSAMREVAKRSMLELDCDMSFLICTTQKTPTRPTKITYFCKFQKNQNRVLSPGGDAGILTITTR